MFCQFLSESLIRRSLTCYFAGVKHKIRSGDIVLIFKADSRHHLVVFTNNGGSICETYIDFTRLRKAYFQEIDIQPDDHTKLSHSELAVLLSQQSQVEYRRALLAIVDKQTQIAKKEKEDYKKLYKYWRNVCYSNEAHFRASIGERYINVAYDYNKIKNERCAIHTELKGKFKLFGKKSSDC